MHCPVCGSTLKEHKSPKGQVFLTCSKWPRCKVSGTPELLERIQTPMERPEPVRLGEFVVKLAQMRIHQSKLNAAKTAEEREVVRKQAAACLSATDA